MKKFFLVLTSGIFLATILFGLSTVANIINQAHVAKADSMTDSNDKTTDGSTTSKSTPKNCFLSGVIRDSKDGKPLSDIVVSIRTVKMDKVHHFPSATTDTQGIYCIAPQDYLQSGIYSMSLVSDARVDGRNYEPFQKENLQLIETNNTFDIDLWNFTDSKPLKEAVYYGFVKDPTGKPFKDGSVTINLKEGRGIGPFQEDQFRALTNADGFYQFVPDYFHTADIEKVDPDAIEYFDVANSNSDNSARPMHYPPERLTEKEHNFTLYYTGVTYPIPSKDFLEKETYLYGIVRDSKDGSPMPNVRVNLDQYDSAGHQKYQMVEFTDGNGFYRLLRSKYYTILDDMAKSGNYLLSMDITPDPKVSNYENYIYLYDGDVVLDPKASQEINVDFYNRSSVKPTKDAIIYGMVTNEQGVPVSTASITLIIKCSKECSSRQGLSENENASPVFEKLVILGNKNGFYQLVPHFLPSSDNQYGGNITGEIVGVRVGGGFSEGYASEYIEDDSNGSISLGERNFVVKRKW